MFPFVPVCEIPTPSHQPKIYAKQGEKKPQKKNISATLLHLTCAPRLHKMTVWLSKAAGN